jgi:hypothetical protein
MIIIIVFIIHMFLLYEYLDSFQYAAASNLGNTIVAFRRRAIPIPSQNYKKRKKGDT